jgi:hypothetical protein
MNWAADLPRSIDSDISRFDFQLIQIAGRSALPEVTFLRLPFEDAAAWETLLSECKERQSMILRSAMRYNESHGILTFIHNHIVPRQNPAGRLLPKNDPRNLVWLFRELNVQVTEVDYQSARSFLY